LNNAITMGQRIRTLLIDDSAFMRKVIGDIITADAGIELVGTAANGKEGMELAASLQPDVVITDMVMPEYDGMYVVHAVMKSRPVPVILLSSLEKTNLRIFDALQSGAFDFVDKPIGLDSESLRDYPLRKLIHEAAQTDVDSLRVKTKAAANRSNHTFESALRYEIIVIGASTGGPGALEYILSNLPSNLRIPVVIGQHMPARFLESFAERLNNHNHLPVRMARNGDVLKGGIVYVVPGDQNTCIVSGAGDIVFGHSTKQFSDFNNPSINCLFNSVADTYGGKTIGVILTGMGRDGVEGLKKIKDNGGFTIAQDEASCIVYGMPKVAVEQNAARQTVVLREIPGFIISCL